MLNDDKNIEYRDQIYYALAEISMKEENKERQFVSARGSFSAGMIAGLTAVVGLGVSYSLAVFSPLSFPILAVAGIIGLGSLLPIYSSVLFFSRGLRIAYALAKHGGIRGSPLFTTPIAYVENSQIEYHPAFNKLHPHIQKSIQIHEQAHLKGKGEIGAYFAQVKEGEAKRFLWVSLGVVLLLTATLSYPYLLSAVGLSARVITMGVGFVALWSLVTIQQNIFKGGYNRLSLYFKNIDELRRYINQYVRPEDQEVKEWVDSQDRTKAELRHFLISQLRLMKKKGSYAVVSDSENITFADEFLNLAKKSRIDLAIEFAQALRTTWNTTAKFINQLPKIAKVIFIPAVLLAVPYFLYMVTYNFFASRSEGNVNFLRNLNEAKIYRTSLVDQLAAIKHIERGIGFISKLKNLWFTFSLYAPVIHGIIGFVAGRAFLALVSWYFAGTITAAAVTLWPELINDFPLLTALFTGIGKLFALIHINNVGTFLIENISPTYANLLRIFFLNLGLSAYASIRSIFCAIQKIDAEEILSNGELDWANNDKIKEYYKSGRISYRNNPELVEIFRDRFGKRKKFQVVSNYSWKLILSTIIYSINTVVPLNLMARIFIENKNSRVKAFFAQLGALKVGFWSGYITLAVIGAEIRTVIGAAEHIGGPAATVANAWEGPNGIISIGGDIIHGGEKAIDYAFSKVEHKPVKIDSAQLMYRLFGGKGSYRYVSMAMERIREVEGKLRQEAIEIVVRLSILLDKKNLSQEEKEERRVLEKKFSSILRKAWFERLLKKNKTLRDFWKKFTKTASQEDKEIFRMVLSGLFAANNFLGIKSNPEDFINPTVLKAIGEGIKMPEEKQPAIPQDPARPRKGKTFNDVAKRFSELEKKGFPKFVTLRGNEPWVREVMRYLAQHNPQQLQLLQSLIKSGKLRAGPDTKEIFYGANNGDIILIADNNNPDLASTLIHELSALEGKSYFHNRIAEYKFKLWQFKKEFNLRASLFVDSLKEFIPDFRNLNRRAKTALFGLFIYANSLFAAPVYACEPPEQVRIEQSIEAGGKKAEERILEILPLLTEPDFVVPEKEKKSLRKELRELEEIYFGKKESESKSGAKAKSVPPVETVRKITEGKSAPEESRNNGKKVDLRQKSQSLKIEKKSSVNPEKKVSSEKKNALPETYIVKKGDTLWKIAGRFLHNPYKWQDLKDAWDKAYPDRPIEVKKESGKIIAYIYPGDKLPLLPSPKQNEKASPPEQGSKESKRNSKPADTNTGKERQLKKPGPAGFVRQPKERQKGKSEASQIKERAPPEPGKNNSASLLPAVSKTVKEKYNLKPALETQEEKAARIALDILFNELKKRLSPIYIKGDYQRLIKDIEAGGRWKELMKKLFVTDELYSVIVSIKEGREYVPLKEFSKYYEKGNPKAEQTFFAQDMVKVELHLYSLDKRGIIKIGKYVSQREVGKYIKEGRPLVVVVKWKEEGKEFKGIYLAGFKAAEKQLQLAIAFARARYIESGLQKVLAAASRQEQIKLIKRSLLPVEEMPEEKGRVLVAAEVRVDEWGNITSLVRFYTQDDIDAAISHKGVGEKRGYSVIVIKTRKGKEIVYPYVYPYTKEGLAGELRFKPNPNLQTDTVVAVVGKEPGSQHPERANRIVFGTNWAAKKIGWAAMATVEKQIEIFNAERSYRMQKKWKWVSLGLGIFNFASGLSGAGLWSMSLRGIVELLFGLYSRKALPKWPKNKEFVEEAVKWLKKQGKLKGVDIHTREGFTKAVDYLRSQLTEEEIDAFLKYWRHQAKDANIKNIFGIIISSLDVLQINKHQFFRDLFNAVGPANMEVSLKCLISFVWTKHILLGKGATLEEIRKYGIGGKGIPAEQLLQFVDVSFDFEAFLNTIWGLFGTPKGKRPVSYAPQSLKSLRAWSAYFFGFDVLSFYKEGFTKKFIQALKGETNNDYVFTVSEGFPDKIRTYTKGEFYRLIEEGKLHVVKHLRTSTGRAVLPIYADEQGNVFMYSVKGVADYFGIAKRQFSRLMDYIKMINKEGGVVTQIIKPADADLSYKQREPQMKVGEKEIDFYTEIVGAFLDREILSHKKQLSLNERKILDKAVKILKENHLDKGRLIAYDRRTYSGFIYQDNKGNKIKVVFIYSLEEAQKGAERLKKSFEVVRAMRDMYLKEPGAVLREAITLNGEPYMGRVIKVLTGKDMEKLWQIIESLPEERRFYIANYQHFANFRLKYEGKEVYVTIHFPIDKPVIHSFFDRTSGVNYSDIYINGLLRWEITKDRITEVPLKSYKNKEGFNDHIQRYSFTYQNRADNYEGFVERLKKAKDVEELAKLIKEAEGRLIEKYHTVWFNILDVNKAFEETAKEERTRKLYVNYETGEASIKGWKLGKGYRWSLDDYFVKKVEYNPWGVFLKSASFDNPYHGARIDRIIKAYKDKVWTRKNLTKRFIQHSRLPNGEKIKDLASFKYLIPVDEYDVQKDLHKTVRIDAQHFGRTESEYYKDEGLNVDVRYMYSADKYAGLVPTLTEKYQNGKKTKVSYGQVYNPLARRFRVKSVDLSHGSQVIYEEFRYPFRSPIRIENPQDGYYVVVRPNNRFPVNFQI